MSPIATSARKTEAQSRAGQQKAIAFGKTAGLSGGAENIFRSLARGGTVSADLQGSDIFIQASEAFKRFQGDQSVQTVGGAGPTPPPPAGPITPPAPARRRPSVVWPPAVTRVGPAHLDGWRWSC